MRSWMLFLLSSLALHPLSMARPCIIDFINVYFKISVLLSPLFSPCGLVNGIYNINKTNFIGLFWGLKSVTYCKFILNVCYLRIILLLYDTGSYHYHCLPVFVSRLLSAFTLLPVPCTLHFSLSKAHLIGLLGFKTYWYLKFPGGLPFIIGVTYLNDL